MLIRVCITEEVEENEDETNLGMEKICNKNVWFTNVANVKNKKHTSKEKVCSSQNHTLNVPFYNEEC